MAHRLLLPAVVGLVSLVVTPGSSLPVDDAALGYPYDASSFNDTAPALLARQNKFELRIMPFGASIMSGQGSSTEDGCRRYVREALRGEGWPVNMVGTKKTGHMKDNDHEAVPGDIITQGHSRVASSFPFKPNVVMINLGTNDAIRSVEVNKAGERMDKILNDIWKAEGMSDTCVFLSTLLPTDHYDGAINRVTINAQYRKLVCDHAKAGKCIYLAEMEHPSLWQGGDFIDGEVPKVHPNDNGHRRMAAVFMNAIHKAIADNKIKPTTGGFSQSGPTSCAKFSGTGVSAGGFTQRGSGDQDGEYFHSSEEKGIRLTTESDFDRDQWRFGRLFSRDYDDLIGWFDEGNGKHVFGVWKNSADGQGSFTRISDTNPDMYCIPRGLHLIDMNGDGLDDVVCIEPAGSLLLSINQGNGDRNANRPPTFKRVPGQIKTAEGYLQEKVRLGDFDGDGRGDYAVLTESGDIRVWRNGGTGDAPAYWHDLGIRFKAKGKGDGRGVRFEDINGDGRDDWMWMDDVGATETWTNSRSCLRAGGEFGLNFAWRQGFASGKTSGNTHGGLAYLATKDDAYLRDRIHFARIYGEQGAWGMLGKQDYVFMQHTKNANKHKFEMKVWKNKGTGGTKTKADGNKYCNMVGHADGKSDYVWTWSTGKMHLYVNRGRSIVYDGDEGFWDEKGDIWTPPRELDRRDLHLADWNGDGTCDIIYVNPNGGKVEVWINNYPKTKTWQWTYLANPAPSLGCGQKRGIGWEDLAVRFADLTGNKRADYLCLEPAGRVTGFVQGDNGAFTNVGQVKFSEEKDRANLRWADVDGDGKDDMLWIDKYTGNTEVWYNKGREAVSGSSFRWEKQSARAYDGNAAGSCEFYTDLNGNGRADQHNIQGTFVNDAKTWFSPPCGLSDRTGDDAIGATLPGIPDVNLGCGGVPSNPDPGDPEESNEKWKQIKCDDSKLTNSADPSKDRWDAAYGTDAFDAMILSFKGNSGGQELSRAASNFFHGRDNMDCQSSAEENGCSTYYLCSDVNYPGGWQVLNSFVSISNTLTNIKGVLGDKYDKFNAELDAISETFQAKAKNVNMDLMFDILSTCFSIATSGLWNAAIKRWEKFADNENLLNVAKDSASAVVLNSMTNIKARMKGSPPLSSSAAFGISLSKSMEMFYDGLDEQRKYIFKGDDESNKHLKGMISGGLMTGTSYAVLDPGPAGEHLERAMFAVLIPMAWIMSEVSANVAVARLNTNCEGDGRPDGRSSRCYGGKVYKLVSAIGKSQTCLGGFCNPATGICAPVTCSNNPLSEVPGIDALDETNYGRLSPWDFITGSIKTFEANGNKNKGDKGDGNGAVKLTRDNFKLDTINIYAPGVMTIPVCGIDELRAAWKEGPEDNPHFPCPKGN